MLTDLQQQVRLVPTLKDLCDGSTDRLDIGGRAESLRSVLLVTGMMVDDFHLFCDGNPPGSPIA